MLVHFPWQELHMAENVSEVGHVRKYAFTWYKRIIRSAVVQKITNGTISSVGKNDYGCP